MKKTKRIALIMICILLFITGFSGCSGNTEMIDFIYPIEGSIKSFDPQIASTADEFLMAENCFEGLVRVLDDKTVQPGVAEKWTISDDGLTYTFHLRKGAKWNVESKDKEKPTKAQQLLGLDFNPDITADDFVFALKRAVDKNTDSPLFSTIANIVNAKQIHSGKKSLGELGVKAIDSYTLEIRLSSPDSGFLTTLSTAIAMPCNEKYFYATNGRYGLGLDYTIFNGQFCVDMILDTSYVLEKNKLYVGDYPTKVTDLTFKIIDSNTDIPKNLKSGYFDCAYISGSEYALLDNDKMTVQPYSNKTWAFILNKNKQLFTNKKLRQAICLSISDADISNKKYLSKAQCLTPASCLIGEESADKAIGKTIPDYDSEKAKKIWKSGLEETGYSKADITVIVTKEMEDTAKQLIQGIQGNIGQITNYGRDNKISFSLKLNVLEKKDFDSAFSRGEYDLALCQFESENQNAVMFLGEIINGNYLGELNNVQKALNSAEHSGANKMAAACRKCEQEIMKDYSIMPVFYEASYYVQAKGVSGIQFHAGSGRVSFVNATREN